MKDLTFGRVSPWWRSTLALAPAGIGTLLAHARLRPHSIWLKMVVAFLLIATVPAALMVSIDQSAIRAALLADAERALSAAALQTATQLDVFIDTNLDAIRTESQLPDFSRYLEPAPNQVADPVIHSDVVDNLRAFTRQSSDIRSYALLDVYGHDVVDTDMQGQGKDESTQDYFVAPFRTRLPYASPVHVDQATGNAYIYFSGLVHGTVGQTIGVLRVRYAANALQRIVLQNNDILGHGSFAMLLDDNDVILGDGLAPQRMLRPVVAPDGARLLELQKANRLLATSEPPPALAALAQGLAHRDAQGFFAAAARPPDPAVDELDQVATVRLSTQPWVVAFVEPQATFNSPLEAQNRSELTLGMVLLLGVIGAATWYTRRLANPIVHLTSVAQRVTTGDLHSDVPIETDDEIGQLAQAFRSMVSAINTREEQLKARADENARLFDELGVSYEHTLEALTAALDMRDTDTEGHSRRVVTYTLALAQRLHMPAREMAALQRGALLHDIGKIGVPDAILRKPGPLTNDEWAVMRHHPEWGEHILASISFLAGAAEFVRSHHERWDGKGYPRGLSGEAIPLGARIFAVADSFDAMMSDRPYRSARTYAAARAEIEAGSGTQFDPQVVETFVQIPEEEWARLRVGRER